MNAVIVDMYIKIFKVIMYGLVTKTLKDYFLAQKKIILIYNKIE
jgi:hypothetical protein